MRKLLTPRQMRDMEREYMDQTRTPSAQLMERAARTLCDAIADLYGADRTVYFACGPGGNGGDGYACARMYAREGGIAVAIEAAPAATPDARLMRERAQEAGVVVTADWRGLPEPDIWVDALFGTGLSRAPEGEAAELIERMNSDSSDVIAVDIPSGLNGRDGRAFAACVCADITITFQRAKTGHYLGDGMDMCGDILVRDIGIPDAFLPEDAALHVNYSDVKPRRRRRNTHKGDYGRVMIIAGSRGMAGAAAICALAAMRSGAGLTTVACPEGILNIIQTLAPCATCLPLEEENGCISDGAAQKLGRALEGADSVVIGCGIGRGCGREIIRAALECGKPAVVDADALNIISTDEGLKALLCERHVITPHPGEARRLLGRDMGDPMDDARDLQAMGPCVILKGASSVICTGKGVYISSSGCPGMAKGGSGDALAGMLGAIMAQGVAPERAAYVASELHGLAGEAAQEEFGERGMLATDLVEMISEVLI